LQSQLRRLASNYQWTWHTRTEQFLRELPNSGPATHPITVIDAMTPENVEALGDDEGFLVELHELLQHLDSIPEPVSPLVAYCSPEFGISALLPIYSGGLGVLAGDHLKAASDQSFPLIGLGLFYSEGVFRQEIEEGRQTEKHYPVVPAAIGATDTGVNIEVPFPGRVVFVRVWSLVVGSVRLLLLNTDVESNSPEDRTITDRLYEGDAGHRLDQEMILGVGGARALAALGLDVPIHHLNEGHAGFLALELIDRNIGAAGFEGALEMTRHSLVFTTHTPVPAGIDRFHRDLIGPYLDIWSVRWGVAPDDLWSLGADSEDSHRFNMAAFCLNVSGAANGVSRLHGEVSRQMFDGVGIGSRISHVTNGVHARTWTSPKAQMLFDEALGLNWSEGDPEAWDRVDAITDSRLLDIRRAGALHLADLVKASSGHKLDPDALVLGFARRFAPYKRATLLFQHLETLGELLDDDSRPIHIVFSGKAHPADEPGKALVAEVAGFATSGESRDRFTFLPDYNMDVARTLVQGCDVWLNNPIRPREASGTSGEKAALNGGLNCSILDGWWAEMYDGRNGWAVPASLQPDHPERDREESSELLRLIGSIAEEYHEGRSIFLGRIRHAWRTLGPTVTAARMIRDYTDQVYRPALDRRANS
jgi:starch phosphorylase